MTGKELGRRTVGALPLPWRRLGLEGRSSRQLAAECAARALMGLLVSRARLYGGLSPFGVALAAATGGGTVGLSALAGILCGYLSGGLIWGVKYALSGLLVYIARCIAQDTSTAQKPWFASLCAGTIFGCVGFAAMYVGTVSARTVGAFCGETALCALSAYLIRIALSPWKETEEGNGDYLHTVSLFFLVSACLACLVPVIPFGVFSVGRILLGLCVMLSAYQGGLAIGCTAGLIFGAAADAASGGTAFFTILYSLSAVPASILCNKRRTVYSILYVLSGGLCVLWLSQSLLTAPALYETFVASVVFLVLPPHFTAKLTALFPGVPAGYGALRARAYTRLRAQRTADAFRQLYETLETALGHESEDADLSTVFDRASQRVCSKCALSRECWQKNYGRTLEVMNGLETILHRRGALRLGDVPVNFSQQCEHLEPLIHTLNSELQGLMRRRLYRARLRQRQDAAYRQYRDMAAILEAMALELGSGVRFEPALERKLCKHLRSLGMDCAAAAFRDCRERLHIELAGDGMFTLRRDPRYLDKLSAVVGVPLRTVTSGCGERSMTLREAAPYCAGVDIAGVSREGQPVSGDRGMHFETEDGRLYVILSDGMGVGEGAAMCSRSAVSILQSFLLAGVQAETALALLCDLMLLENEASTVCATVDLLEIDLFSGEGALYKFGAAPTYLCRGTTVRRLRSRTPAVGLFGDGEGLPPPVHLRLEGGMRAILISDGILGGGDDTWLRELMPNLESDTAAQQILQAAQSRCTQPDDMTVITLAIRPRDGEKPCLSTEKSGYAPTV